MDSDNAFGLRRLESTQICGILAEFLNEHQPRQPFPRIPYVNSSKALLRTFSAKVVSLATFESRKSLYCSDCQYVNIVNKWWSLAFVLYFSACACKY